MSILVIYGPGTMNHAEEPWFSAWMLILPLTIGGAVVGFIWYRRHQDEMMMIHLAEVKRSQDEKNEQQHQLGPYPHEPKHEQIFRKSYKICINW